MGFSSNSEFAIRNPKFIVSVVNLLLCALAPSLRPIRLGGSLTDSNCGMAPFDFHQIRNPQSAIRNFFRFSKTKNIWIANKVASETSKMNRAFLTFFLGLTIGFLGICTGHAQSASAAPKPVSGNVAPVVKPRPATAQKPVTANSNTANQKLSEPEQTKIVALYRGNGSFDAELAQKVRPVLVKTFHLENEAQTASASGNPQSSDNPIARAVEALAPSLVKTDSK
jgi:hypothetical protein